MMEMAAAWSLRFPICVRIFLFMITLIIWLIRIFAATAITLVAGLAVMFAYWTFAPMDWWVRYDRIEVVITPPGSEELIRIWRHVNPSRRIVEVERKTELQELTMLGVRQYCLETVNTSASIDMKPPILSGLSDYIGERCADRVLPMIEGHIVRLQIIYSIVHPFNIRDGVKCTTGPFVVKDGFLQRAVGADGSVVWATSSGVCSPFS
jgi:hypothetical protein